jgi:hypothetical protein
MMETGHDRAALQSISFETLTTLLHGHDEPKEQPRGGTCHLLAEVPWGNDP